MSWKYTRAFQHPVVISAIPIPVGMIADLAFGPSLWIYGAILAATVWFGAVGFIFSRKEQRSKPAKGK